MNARILSYNWISHSSKFYLWNTISHILCHTLGDTVMNTVSVMSIVVSIRAVVLNQALCTLGTCRRPWQIRGTGEFYRYQCVDSLLHLHIFLKLTSMRWNFPPPHSQQPFFHVTRDSTVLPGGVRSPRYQTITGK